MANVPGSFCNLELQGREVGRRGGRGREWAVERLMLMRGLMVI